MSNIHSSAVIDDGAIIGENVFIGPNCIIHKDVNIGDNCVLDSNVVVAGNTKIGKGNHFFHSAVIGTQPQDLKYKGEDTELYIGDNNNFREFVTVNKSATLDEPTRIGSNNLLMAYSHVAHNCQIGNHVIIANTVQLAGHIHINDNVIIGGMTAVHQFVKIGEYSFVGGASGVKKDVPPFTRGEGMPYKVAGLNSVGLRRNGFSRESIRKIKAIYKIFYKSGRNVTQALEHSAEMDDITKEQQKFINFVKNADRGICKSI
mgnify:CR=1 FL=1